MHNEVPVGVRLSGSQRSQAGRSNAQRRAGGAPVLVERLEGRLLMKAFLPIFSASLLDSNDPTSGAAFMDDTLLNPVGIAVAPNGQLFVANNNSGFATTYNTNGVPQPTPDNPLTIAVPVPPGGAGGAPTGVVYHKGGGFNVGTGSSPSTLIFATQNGVIAGYNAKISPQNAILKVDNSASGAVYTGLAQVGSGSSAKIYATDFHNNRIDIFNSKFEAVKQKKNAFVDPLLPAGFSTFGIQTIGNKIYVSYARLDPDGRNDDPLPANGLVDVYSTSGRFIRRLATGGKLNSPWGMAQVPGGWGVYNGDLLVGNVGDGTINVYDKKDRFLGQVPDPFTGFGPFVVPGLWGLSFGQGKAKHTLYLSAGVNDRTDGLLGALNAKRPKKH